MITWKESRKFLRAGQFNMPEVSQEEATNKTTLTRGKRNERLSSAFG